MGLNLTIGAELAAYVEDKVRAGEFRSPEEVVEQALRLLQAQDRTDDVMNGLGPGDLARLRAAWHEGLESGDLQPLNMEEIKREGRRRHDAER